MEIRNNNLNMQSSVDDKRKASQAVFERLGDAFFDNINLISIAYSDFGDGGVYGASRGTTDTTNHATGSRLIDTTGGKFLDPSKESRMRCNFYIRSGDKLNGYLLSPALLDSENLGTIQDLSSLRAYIGLKFDSGIVYVVSKENGKNEVTYSTNIDIGTATFTETFTLEISYRLTATEILVNNELVGTFSSDMGYDSEQTVTFYPLFSPGKSTDGTLVNIVVENFQFIQSK